MLNEDTPVAAQATITTSINTNITSVNTCTTAANADTTTAPVRRHSLVHRHSSAAYAMEHAPILTHPALDKVDKISVPPLPPRTYKSSGSTDSLSSDSCSPAQNKRSNNLSDSDSEPEEAFIPLAKPNMRFKVDVSQWKAPYGSTLPSSSSDGLQQTSIPEEYEMASQSLSSPPPPLPPKPSQPSSCTCTCHGHHHHHDVQHKTASKKRRHQHSKLGMHEGRRRSSQLSLTPQSSLTSHSSINSQPSFGSDTSGIQEDHEFDSAIAMLNEACQSLSTAATSIGRNEHSGKTQGSFQIDFNAIPTQPKPAEYLEPISTSPQPHHTSHDPTLQSSSYNMASNIPPKSSRTLCRLCPPSFVTTSSSSTVFASHVRHH